MQLNNTTIKYSKHSNQQTTKNHKQLTKHNKQSTQTPLTANPTNQKPTIKPKAQ